MSKCLYDIVNNSDSYRIFSLELEVESKLGLPYENSDDTDSTNSWGNMEL